MLKLLGAQGEFRRIDSLVQYDSSISLRHDNHRCPVYGIDRHGNAHSNYGDPRSRKSHHSRRMRKHRRRECIAMGPIIPNADANIHSRYSRPIIPIHGPASLPPPSPYSRPHLPNPYSSRSHRKFRQKYTPYRNKNHRNHRHHYDRYRYQNDPNYDYRENNDQYMGLCNDPSCYCYRYKPHPESDHSAVSTPVNCSMGIEMNGSYCSSCDEVESCLGSQCTYTHNYSDHCHEKRDKRSQSRQRTPSTDFKSISHQDDSNCIPPLLPPKKLLRYYLFELEILTLYIYIYISSHLISKIQQNKP